jgi:hypothetical protein
LAQALLSPWAIDASYWNPPVFAVPNCYPALASGLYIPKRNKHLNTLLVHLKCSDNNITQYCYVHQARQVLPISKKKT